MTVTSASEICDYCSNPAVKRVDNFRGYEIAVSCDDCLKYSLVYVFPIDSPECGERHI